MVGLLQIVDAARIIVADWLSTVLFSSSYVFIDIWAFIHLFSGFLGGFLLSKTKIKSFSSQLFLWFAVLVLYEALELWFISSESGLFNVEQLTNVMWDLVAGLAGFIIFTGLFNKASAVN